MILFLGLIDVICGGNVVFHFLLGIELIVVLGIILIVKGISSIISSVAVGFYADIMGILDLVTGILMTLEILPQALWILGLLVFLKGIYSVIFSISF